MRQTLETSLKEHVDYLAGTIGERSPFTYQNLERARRYIEMVLTQIGYHLEHDCYRVGDREYRNVIVESKGAVAPEKVFVIGAHYDTVPGTPGADDNASGVACLLELARFKYQQPPPITIRFVAFTLEEPPYFGSPQMGSRIHAQKSRQRRDHIVGMASLEMVGCYIDEPNSQGLPLRALMRWFYPDCGNFVALAGNLFSRRLVRKLARALERQNQIPVESIALPFVPGVDLSDNSSFWKEGYQALMITDTAFFRNPHYHLPSDVSNTLNYERMAGLVLALAGAVAQLCPVRKK